MVYRFGEYRCRCKPVNTSAARQRNVTDFFAPLVRILTTSPDDDPPTGRVGDAAPGSFDPATGSESSTAGTGGLNKARANQSKGKGAEGKGKGEGKGKAGGGSKGSDTRKK
jgi:hypothetical protein